MLKFPCSGCSLAWHFTLMFALRIADLGKEEVNGDLGLESLPEDESPGPPGVQAGHLHCSGEGLAALVNVLHGGEGLVLWCSLL